MRSWSSRSQPTRCRSRTWSGPTAHGGIGYKTIGRIPIRRGDCPDLPEAGLDGRVRLGRLRPLRGAARGARPQARLRRHGQQPHRAARTIPHHITSEYLDGYRARRIEQLIEETAEHDLDGFAAMQTDNYSIPGDRDRPPAGPAEARRTSALVRAIELLRSWDGRMEPDSVAATIYQAFTIRLAREFAREVIRDRDLAERWLDRSTTGFTTHVTSPWRWQTRLMDLWEEGDDELIGRSWDELALDSLRAALDELADRFGRDPAGWTLGPRPPARVPARPRRGQPRLRARLQPRRRGRRRPGDGQPDRLRPQRSLQGGLGAELADGHRHVRSRRRPLADVHRPVGPARQPPLRRAPGALAPRRDAADGRRGPLERTLTLDSPSVSRRDQIKLSDDEQRELLESERVVTVATHRPARLAPHDAALVRRSATARSGSGPTRSRRR